jgi:hypothetical protein
MGGASRQAERPQIGVLLAGPLTTEPGQGNDDLLRASDPGSLSGSHDFKVLNCQTTIGPCKTPKASRS